MVNAKLLHTIWLLLFIILIQIGNRIEFHSTKCICYPKKLLNKFWKMNKRFVVKEEFFEKSIDIAIRNNCSLDLILDELACFHVGNGYINDGAFIEDFLVKKTTTTTSQSTTTSTELQTTTSTKMNPIQCLNPKWALVQPAVIYMQSQQLGKVPEDYALRAGFMDYLNGFEEKHINQTIMVKQIFSEELLKNSTTINQVSDKIRDELADWIGKNGEWVQNIEHGKFQYFPITNSFAQTNEIAMLLYECSFGKFIFGPVELDKSIQNAENYNWKKDFDQLDECIEKQVDISKRRKKYLSLRSYQLRYNYNAVMELLNVNIWIGININNDTNTTFGDAEFEAFKYKYGYTHPLRSPGLDECANNCERVRRMGRIILPIESVSRNLNSYRLDSYFRKISRRYLIELKLAKDDCKGAEEKYGVDDCVVCLIEGEDCFPIVEVKIIQTIYKCHKYTLRLPRVDGHANFTANGTNYRYINQVGWYQLMNGTYNRKMNAMVGIGDYILYDDGSIYNEN